MRPARAHWLREFQRHRCALCGAPEPLRLDHDHQTNRIRGWLCHPCNVREGKTLPGSDPRLDEYRRWPPTTILGVDQPYRGFAFLLPDGAEITCGELGLLEMSFAEYLSPEGQERIRETGRRHAAARAARRAGL